MSYTKIQLYKQGSCNFEYLQWELFSQLSDNFQGIEYLIGAENFNITCLDDTTVINQVETIVSNHNKIEADQIIARRDSDINKADIILEAVCNDPEDKFKIHENLLDDEQKNQNRAMNAILCLVFNTTGMQLSDLHDQIVNGQTYTAQQKYDSVRPDGPSSIQGLTNEQYSKLIIDKVIGINLEIERLRNL